MDRIFFEGSSSDEFMRRLCSKISEIIESHKQTNQQEPEALLTRQAAADMLQISLPTLNNWTKAGILTPRYLGRRVYYKKSEIINSLNR
ncbi:helix-turn-helix domain-containing protein [Gaetbulibacter aquiaggeris]|uniref:Helix-turn-helix domain-containing protein n=1 Tax=Gaetbulibacter aquiaggeris TaxID=1735373 RepID=A0ABW7ML24_9FLAO